MKLKNQLEKLGYTVVLVESEEDYSCIIFKQVGLVPVGQLLVDKDEDIIWKLTLNGTVSDVAAIVKLVEDFNNEK